MNVRGRSRRVLAALLAGAVALGVGVAVPLAAPEATADAAVGANFDAGFIISDEAFYNRASMNVGQIQAFLSDKGSGCHAAAVPCLKDIRVDVTAKAADAYCAALPAASQVSAAQLFQSIGVACGINPQVLLVLVEKEQSLVSRTSPSLGAYQFATGFNCPDTAPCDTASAGLVTQVYLAARQFQRYRVNPGGYNFQAGRNNNILYSPKANCGSSSVYIRNQATAGLYDYTPYQPDSFALANLYGGGGDCSSYGNRNFWRMFTDWFGGTSNLLDAASFEGSVAGWGFANGALQRLVTGPTDTEAKSGRYYLSMYASTPSRSLSQDVPLTVQPRQAFTGSIWVKSGTAGKSFSGVLAVWGLGGQTEQSAQAFTVGNDWTQITTTLNITRSGHNKIRLEVYLNSTDALLSMDATSLTASVAQAPRDPLTLSSPSFEGGIGTWGFKNGFMNRQVYNVGTAAAHDGTWILAANTTAPVRSVGQDIPWTASPGDSYTGTIWVRSSSSTQTFSGTVALWGLGSTAEAGVTNFTVGPNWTPISATLNVTQNNTSTLRLEVYLNTVNFDLYLDDASITPNLALNGSFETGTAAGWGSGTNGVSALTAVRSGTVPSVDGSYLATTTTTGGSFATDISRQTVVGESYTATLWLRATVPSNSWDGTLALWGLGGTQEVATTPISVTDTWTQVKVTLPIAQVDHATLRVEVYSNSPGEFVDVDALVIR